MKYLFSVAGSVLVLSLNACNERPTQPNNTSPLIGTWIEKTAASDTTVMARAIELHQDKYGFVFDDDGTFLERKNAGWCGTPPISYGNFAGEWLPESDTTIHIDVDYWGGRMKYDMRIISLTASELTFVRQFPP